MTDWESCKAVERNPGKLGGAWVFQGTRVPVSALFENLRDGATVDQFLRKPFGDFRLRGRVSNCELGMFLA